MQAFDKEAFIAAAAALGSQPFKPVNLPGLPSCFKRELKARDVMKAAAIREKLSADGIEINEETNMAIGVAQVLCNADGEPIFDAANPAHIDIVANLPWKTLRSIEGDQDAAVPNASKDRSST